MTGNIIIGRGVLLIPKFLAKDTSIILACRRVFPSGSRPLLYSTCNADTHLNAKVTLEKVVKSQRW